MFDGFRDKLNNFQENISVTLKSFSASESSPNKKPMIKVSNSVNLNAGVALLEKFQSSWCELHDASQENATQAEKVDFLITNLHINVKKQWKGLTHLTGMITCLPEIGDTISNIHEKTLDLKHLFETVERSMIQLQDILDMKDFECRVIDQKFQLAFHEQKKFAELENLRLSLEKEHNEELLKNDKKRQVYLKDESGIPYSQDIRLFKEPVPKITLNQDKSSFVKPTTSLYDIVLIDENPENIEEFLKNEAKPSDEIQ